MKATIAKPSHGDIMRLLDTVVVSFYLIKRDMRVTKGKRRTENDAEHSWSLALLACAMAPHLDPTLDIGRVCQFAIVHDLVELYAADTSPWGSQKKIADKKIREKASWEKLKAQTITFPWIAETIKAYESKSSNEARFVCAVDKYLNQAMRNLDNGTFYRSIGLTKEKFNQRLESHWAKANIHKAVGAYYEQSIAEAHAIFDKGS